MRHLFLGTILIALGLWGMFSWWAPFGLVMRGLLPFGALALGMLALLSSYYRISEAEEDLGGDDSEEI